MRTVTTRCSLALMLRDGFTAEPPSPSAVTVRARGSMRKPIRKPDGIWVFTDLDGDETIVDIESPIYIEQRLAIATSELDRLNPLVAVSLSPARAYPLPAGATVVTAAVSDKRGRPVAGASVELLLTEERAARARLAADAGAGDRQLEAVRVAGKPAAGDVYMLRSREGKPLERCIVSGYGDDARKLLLASPLKKPVPRGSLMMPVLSAATDDKGRVRFALRPSLPSPEAAVSLKVSHGKRLFEGEFRIREGIESGLGPIILG